MAASFCMKRLTKERERFTIDDSEFWVNWKDDSLRKFEAYIIGAEDSVYKHKLIKLRFDIPDNYPIVPPKVTFVQHTGDRVHPNLYSDGKVCLSILGTWSGPGWTGNMNVESVLRTLRSLLDQKPYLHEPNQSDRPEFNNYVRYHSWRWLLLDYLERETDAEAKAWLEKYMMKYGSDMIVELERQRDMMRSAGQGSGMSSPYAVRAQHVVDCSRLLADLKMRIPRMAEAPDAGNPRGQIMEDARAKRKLPIEIESASTSIAGSSPAKKRHIIIDLE